MRHCQYPEEIQFEETMRKLRRLHNSVELDGIVEISSQRIVPFVNLLPIPMDETKDQHVQSKETNSESEEGAFPGEFSPMRI